MMTRSRALLSLSLIALFVGLAAGPASADDSKEFAGMHKAWQKAYNDRDAKALAAMYTEDGTVMPPNSARSCSSCTSFGSCSYRIFLTSSTRVV